MKKIISNPKILSRILVLLLVLSIAVVATFSWYNRTASNAGEGNKFSYTQSGKINGDGGSIATYVGTNDNGKITYSTTPLSTSNDVISTEPGAVNYFKTVVTDNSNADSLISVYLENFTYSSSMNSSIHIGLTNPEKTYKEFDATLTGGSYVIKSLCLEDNVPIAKGGTVEIYWFIKVDENFSGTGSITLGNLHLVYN